MISEPTLTRGSMIQILIFRVGPLARDSITRSIVKATLPMLVYVSVCVGGGEGLVSIHIVIPQALSMIPVTVQNLCDQLLAVAITYNYGIIQD